MFDIGLIVISGLLVIGIILLVGDNLVKIEATKTGLSDSGNVALLPSLSTMFGIKPPTYANEERFISLEKGHDILLEGDPEEKLYSAGGAKTYAVQPQNFIGMSPIPKVVVEVGQEVSAGEELFFDKKRPEIKYVSPVSGEVIAINRGEKRAISEIVILGDKEMKYKTLSAPSLDVSRDQIVQFLLDSGGWSMLRERPFDVVPDIDAVPKSIFISTFDSAPLAPDLDYVVEGKEAAFQKGLDVLNKLTSGFVHIGLDARDEELPPSDTFTNAVGVEKTYFRGPHPSGNVGVHIHHVDPINTGDKVWYLGVQEVITLGTLFLENKYDASRLVALGGAELDEAAYYNTYQGANLNDLVQSHLKHDHVRIVSGDLLSGKEKSKESYLNFYDDQISVIKEGDEFEFFGWLLPLSARPSISRTFPNFIFPDIKFEGNTNSHGERRAFVVTGQYESVLPMDIFPQHLFKAITINDFERMEGLGIFELSEEDVALCEFACTSKQPLQKILREGLNTMREQL